jgi:AcrR family transcriptional regulator
MGNEETRSARVDRRRTDTRQRIQEAALELFGERGYDATSLREIAERLGVTKAALYFHFRTKEQILDSISDDLATDVDELIAWAHDQPRSAAAREEILRRVAAVVRGRWRPLIQLAQVAGPRFRDRPEAIEGLQRRAMAIMSLLRDPDAPLLDQLRSILAVATVYFGNLPLPNPAIPMSGLDASEADVTEATMTLALELLAHAGEVGPTEGPTSESRPGNT